MGIYEEVGRLPVGVGDIDEALGGGLPKGRIVELFGKPDTGKRTIALTALANLDKGYGCEWVDLIPDGLDRWYGRQCGFTRQTHCYYVEHRDPLRFVEQLIRTGQYTLIVVNGAELIGSGNQMGIQSRLLHQQMRSICGAAHSLGVTVLMLHNQARPFIDVGSIMGNLLRYYASVRIHLSSTQWSHQNRRGIVGQGVVVKNKYAPPFARFGFVVQHSRGLVAKEKGAKLATA